MNKTKQQTVVLLFVLLITSVETLVCVRCLVGPRLRPGIPQGLVADDSGDRRDIRRDGLHVAVRSSRSQAGVSVYAVGSGTRRRRQRLRAELSRLPRAALLHRSAATG